MLSSINKAQFAIAERALFDKLDASSKIQDYLNKLAFNFDNGGETMYSPREVIKRKRAHCMEGAMLAGVALWWHGRAPLLLDLRSDKGDIDHIVALFKEGRFWGAISKTNHAVLRYREPVYLSLRELVMSYFHEYFLKNGRKTLREYSKPFDLSHIKDQSWMISRNNLWGIETAISKQFGYSLFTDKQISNLRKADKVERTAGEILEWE